MSIDTRLDENEDRMLELNGMPFVVNRQLEKDCGSCHRVGLTGLSSE